MKEDNGLLEAQLKIGKVVLEQMLELIYRPNMRGVVMPFELNGYKYNISIVRGRRMTLNERVRANERSVANGWLIMTALAFVILLFAVGLITSTEHQQRQISELKTGLQKKTSEIEKLQNKNSAQDIILNKLNTEYQLKERQKAEEAKRIADANGVGG